MQPRPSLRWFWNATASLAITLLLRFRSRIHKAIVAVQRGTMHYLSTAALARATTRGLPISPRGFSWNSSTCSCLPHRNEVTQDMLNEVAPREVRAFRSSSAFPSGCDTHLGRGTLSKPSWPLMSMSATHILSLTLGVAPPFPKEVPTPASPSILLHMRWCPSLTGRRPDDRGLAKSPEIWQNHGCRHGQRLIHGPHAGTQTPWAIWSFPTTARPKSRWNARVTSARIAQIT